ncbi:class I tRNA ligase family protein, partial [Candidatus Pacearchaeota archaeon]|nr:class I tRNA ligase family protein [Candidatus Pacearchaeota archaeon]
MKIVNFSSIDKKWQKEWEKAKLFEAKEDTKKEKYYALEMYPYPSGSGLHIGHAFNYTLGDILARFMRMNGKSVLHPMGFDSFGLPAENAAIKEGAHPRKYTDTAIKRFIDQQKALGLSYDWSRKIQSHDPEYYRWNQYFFLQFLKKGLVYRKESPVNWCNKCESVLANEQVHNGKCWRHTDIDVVIRNLEQWFVKTTKYADELLKDVDSLDWPERIKAMQKNWIGKSEGTEV